jgi:ammonium transporter, Amt family
VTTMFQDDGIWLISCSFSIWTMVSGQLQCLFSFFFWEKNSFKGFGLLESGRVSSKDEVNIMVKNVVDVVFGGLSYWMFGFGEGILIFLGRF